MSLTCVRFTLIFCKPSNFKFRSSYTFCRVQNKMKTQGPGQGQGNQSFLPTAHHPNSQQKGDPPGIANTTPRYIQYLNGRWWSSPSPSNQLDGEEHCHLTSRHCGMHTPSWTSWVCAQAPAGEQRAAREHILLPPQCNLVIALVGSH